ncbi:AlkZ-related protein [Paenibacillus thermotolerans]|uniref:AlkZ-related protein n=1 Tax=Paenibacillus thermotolerans TaxID=3027807 RepID=UPI0023689D71|nr:MULTISPECIES: hypothetical protein [unclassified Paenibacillus]
MQVFRYEEFVQFVEKHKILPFSEFVPEYPSLTAAAANNDWHSGTDTDPWLWRIRIVHDGVAAYGKFFGAKACFIHKDLFPAVRTVLTNGKSVDQRYEDGLLSRTAYRMYQVLTEEGNIDSRNLRKKTGLQAREYKKEYEKSLVELQNFGDAVITGASKQSETDSGWSSMCYEPSDMWVKSVQGDDIELSVEAAKKRLTAVLSETCSPKSFAFFAKKLKVKIME